MLTRTLTAICLAATFAILSNPAQAGFISNAGKVVVLGAVGKAMIVKQGIENRETVRTTAKRLLRADAIIAKCLVRAATSNPCKTN
jgi:hypothetical protein